MEKSYRYSVVLAFFLLSYCRLSWAQAATVIVPTGFDVVANGSNFQAALNSASCGDTIVLQSGATYQGSFILRYKAPCTGTDTDYITIQPSNLTSLPTAGVRLNPSAHGPALAKVRSVSDRVFRADTFAHHYKLIGLDVSTTGTAYVPDLIDIGVDGSAGGYPTYAELLAQANFMIDRCFIHPAEISATQLVNDGVLTRTSGRGVQANGVNITVQNSYIAGFTGYYSYNPTEKVDSYGVFATSGPGPLYIRNNYIEAWFNNIFLGGGKAINTTGNKATVSPGATLTQATLSTVANISVGDYIAFLAAGGTQYGSAQIDAISGTTVTYHGVGPGRLSQVPDSPGLAMWKGLLITGQVQGNTLYKQPSWITLVPSGAKMYIEVKNANGLLIDGNTFDGAAGPAMVGLTARNQAADGPWITIKNVTISNNLVKAGSILATAILDNEQTTTPGANVMVTNNLWTGGVLCSSMRNWIESAGGSDVTLTHNTVRCITSSMGGSALYNTGAATIVNGQQWGQRNLTIRDNVIANGRYGINANTAQPGGASAAWPPSGPIESKNVVFKDPNTDEGNTFLWPNSYLLSSASGVGFVNLADADAGGDYHGYALASTSPFKGKASDGADPGVDFAALDAASSGSGTTGGTTAGSTGGLPGPTNLIVK